jgi:hypothetical protein
MPAARDIWQAWAGRTQGRARGRTLPANEKLLRGTVNNTQWAVGSKNERRVASAFVFNCLLLTVCCLLLFGGVSARASQRCLKMQRR